jgi:hypothetical protein
VSRIWHSDPEHAPGCVVDGGCCSCRVTAQQRPTLAELLDALVPVEVELEQNWEAS